MAANKNYDRQKLVVINDTPMNMAILVGEQPDPPIAIGGTGTTAIMDAKWTVDADEGAGVDIQDHAKFTITPLLNKVTGKMQYQVDFIPVNGDASDAAQQTHVFDHDELMDDWQVAAGRARQP